MEDSKIIELLFARNEDGIKHMDDTYGRRLFVLADNIVKNDQDAEESVSDTYMKAWDTIPPKKPMHLFAYLAKICRNFALKKLDWKTAAKRNAEVVSLTQEMENCIPDASRDREVEAKELAEAVGRFLDTVSYTERKVFLMRYFDLAKIQNIASEFNMSTGKVKSMLYRTRNKLREHLQKEGY